MMSLMSQVILVTGASSGFGQLLKPKRFQKG